MGDGGYDCRVVFDFENERGKDVFERDCYLGAAFTLINSEVVRRVSNEEIFQSARVYVWNPSNGRYEHSASVFLDDIFDSMGLEALRETTINLN